MALLCASRARIYMAIACTVLCGACSKPEIRPSSTAANPSGGTVAVIKPDTPLAADPNPIIVSDGSGLGETLVTWTTTKAQIQVRVGAPDGKLFAAGGAKGSARTGKWVSNGTTFYLQDGTAPNPNEASATLGTLAVAVK